MRLTGGVALCRSTNARATGTRDAVAGNQGGGDSPAAGTAAFANGGQQRLTVHLGENAGGAPSRPPFPLPANTATGGEIWLNPLGLAITVEKVYGP